MMMCQERSGVGEASFLMDRHSFRARQMEGIAKAKERGVYKGRKKSIDRDRIKELRLQGWGATKIARELGCERTSVYRILNAGV
jgi:DNA invertase Pin-like site-specific DNA recombinase